MAGHRHQERNSAQELSNLNHQSGSLQLRQDKTNHFWYFPRWPEDHSSNVSRA